MLIWMKQIWLIWFNLQGDGTGNGLSNIKNTFAESLQLRMSVLHQIVYICLSISYDDWEKYKEKVLNMSESNKMLKKHAIPNSSLHNLKIYSPKGCIKTSQR